MPTKKTSSTVRNRRGDKATGRTPAYMPINVVHMSDFLAARGQTDSVRYQRLRCMAIAARVFGIDAAQREFDEAMQRELRFSFLA